MTIHSPFRPSLEHFRLLCGALRCRLLVVTAVLATICGHSSDSTAQTAPAQRPEGGLAGYTWPSDIAPCTTSLQACLDGSPRPVSIKVGADAPVISGDILVRGEVYLRAVPGARPVFRNAVLYLILSEPGSAMQSLENLILEESQIRPILGTANSAETHIASIYGVKIRNQSVSPAVRVEVAAVGSDNQVKLFTSEVNAFEGLRIARGDSDQGLRVSVGGNLFRQPDSSLSTVIDWAGMDAGSYLKVTGNRFEGLPYSRATAVALSTFGSTSTSGAASAHFERNVFAGVHGPIVLQEGVIALDVMFRHNSLLMFENGISLFRGAGPLSVTLANNVFQDGVRSINTNSAAGAGDSLNVIRNLYWRIGSTGGIPGTNPLTADPLTRGRYDARVQQGSPAIDAAEIAQPPTLDDQDFDGIVGIRGSARDIGAFEWTDAASFALETGSGNVFGNTAQIPASMLSASLGDVGLAQRVIAGNGAGLPSNANKHLGIYRSGDRYDLFTQDLSPFPTGSFRVLRPGLGSYARDTAFVHRAINEVGNPNNNTLFHETLIDNSLFPASLGNVLSLGPQVLQRFDPPGSAGTYNNHPVGLYFGSGQFRLINMDLANLPSGAGFHVLASHARAPYSTIVQSHAATPLSALPLPHPLLNDNPCAHVYVSSNWGTDADPGNGVYIPSALLVRYDASTNGGGQWLAVRGDGQNFAPASKVYVYFDPEVAHRCMEDNPFADSFE